MPAVRFFHALPTLSEPVSFSVEGGPCLDGLTFGGLTGYVPCPSGFRRVTIAGTRTRAVFLQKTLPLPSPGAFTLALIPGTVNLNLLRIPDVSGYSGHPDACFLRAVSLTDDPPVCRLSLYGGCPLFDELYFREITCHKRLPDGPRGLVLALPRDSSPLAPAVFPARRGFFTCYLCGSLRGGTLGIRICEDTPDAPQTFG